MNFLSSTGLKLSRMFFYWGVKFGKTNSFIPKNQEKMDPLVCQTLTKFGSFAFRK